jgi:cobalt-zinc-cadmium efflux system outer membrane protein
LRTFFSRTAVWIQILCLAALTSCARFKSEPLSATKTAEQFDERSLGAEPLRTFLEKANAQVITNWPKSDWNFDDLSLAAFFYHPDLAVARAQLGVIQAGEKTAGQRPNPTMSVSPGYNATTAMASPWLFVSSLDVPIETAGKRGYRQKQAARLADSARLNIATTAWQVRSRVRAAMLDLIAAERRAPALQAQVSLQQELLKRARQQIAAGAVAPRDESQARIAEARARIDLADSQRQALDARARLAEAIGVPLRAVERIKFSENPFVKVGIEGLSSAEARTAALTSRADILAGLADYAAAEAALQLEIAKQYPDVHLQPGYEFDQGDSKWSLGLTVELPVLNQNQGPIAEAAAKRIAAAEKFKASQAHVIAEVDRAVANWQTSESNAAGFRQLEAEQKQRKLSIEQQVQVGAAEQTELLNVQLETTLAQLSVLDAELKLQAATGALEDAIQRPLQLSPALLEKPDEH